jgi:hypothetical protein
MLSVNQGGRCSRRLVRVTAQILLSITKSGNLVLSAKHTYAKLKLGRGVLLLAGQLCNFHLVTSLRRMAAGKPCNGY